ncbi:hypothetical protein M405DRAFT_834441 [Rhizopogon salebrosus TDB-379]|nr:hypothetical protein M405DRAFT_834441 [Rhizopogon salebrosus TDB-379]
MTSQPDDFGLLNQGASRLSEDESNSSSEDETSPEPEELEDFVQGSNTGFVERGPQNKDSTKNEDPPKNKGKDKGKGKDKSKSKSKSKEVSPAKTTQRTTALKPPQSNPDNYRQ